VSIQKSLVFAHNKWHICRFTKKLLYLCNEINNDKTKHDYYDTNILYGETDIIIHIVMPLNGNNSTGTEAENGDKGNS
jgi:hypothetical protein